MRIISVGSLRYTLRGRKFNGPTAVVAFGGLLTLASATAPRASTPVCALTGSHSAFNRMLVQTVASMPTKWMSPLVTMRMRPMGRAFAPLTGQTIPILMVPTPINAIGGVDSVSVAIAVDQTGDSIQVGTDSPSLLTSPSSAWPYDLSYPSGGSTTKTITLTTHAVTTSTVVTIYACPSGVDSSNPANWSYATTVTVRPVGWTLGGGGGA